MAITMNTTTIGAGPASSLTQMTMMRPFSNLIDNLERIGVQYVVMRTNDGHEHQIHLSAWREEHLFQGVRVGGRLLCPNAMNAYLNPFLPQPSLVVTCDSIALAEKDGDDDRGGQTPAVVADSVNYQHTKRCREAQPHPLPCPQQAPVQQQSTQLPTAAAAAVPQQVQAPIVEPTPAPTPIPVPPVQAASSTPVATVPAQTPIAPIQARVHSGAVAVLDKSEKTDKKKGGSSCHQCKNVKSPEGLVFCQRKFDRRHRSDKRNCRKKYCPHCLMKFYNIAPQQYCPGQVWHCPSCTGICRCAACARSHTKSPLVNRSETANSSETVLKPEEGASYQVLGSPSIRPATAMLFSSNDHPSFPDSKISLNGSLDLPEQFGGFGHASPASSAEENNEMLAAPSAGDNVQSSHTAGSRLDNSSEDAERDVKRQRQAETQHFALVAE